LLISPLVFISEQLHDGLPFSISIVAGAKGGNKKEKRAHSVKKPSSSSIVFWIVKAAGRGARIDYELASLSNEIYNGNLFQDEPVQLFFF
jgi:prolipoprotein diacylglyceryltransferase